MPRAAAAISQRQQPPPPPQSPPRREKPGRKELHPAPRRGATGELAAARGQEMLLDAIAVQKLKALLLKATDDAESVSSAGFVSSNQSETGTVQEDAMLTVSPVQVGDDLGDCNTGDIDSMELEIRRLQHAAAALTMEEKQLGQAALAVHAEVDQRLGAMRQELQRRRAAIEASIETCQRRKWRRDSADSAVERRHHPKQRDLSARPDQRHRHKTERRRHHQHRRFQSASSDAATNGDLSLHRKKPLDAGQQLQRLQLGLRDLLGFVSAGTPPPPPPPPPPPQPPQPASAGVASGPQFGRLAVSVQTGGRPLGACACANPAGFSCRPSRLLVECRPAGGSWRALPVPCLYVHFALTDGREPVGTWATTEDDEDGEDDEGEEAEADVFIVAMSGKRLARIRFGASVRRIRLLGQTLFVATANGRVLECDLAGRRRRAIEGLLRPSGLCADASSLFVYEAGRSRVAVYDNSNSLQLTGVVQLRASDRRLPACACLAVLGDWLVLADSRRAPCDRCQQPGETSRRLLVFDPAGNRMVATMPEDARRLGYCLHEPCSLAADGPRSLVYVCDRRLACVLALAVPSGRLVARLGQSLPRPQRLSAPCSLDLIEAVAAAAVAAAEVGATALSGQLLLVCDTRRGRVQALEVGATGAQPMAPQAAAPQLVQQEHKQLQSANALADALARTLQLLSEAC